MKNYILAIDIGTSGAKVLLWDKTSGRTFAETAGYKTRAPHPGWADQDPADWYMAVRQAIPALLRKSEISADEICAIGVDGISWTPVCLDREGDVLCEAPIWHDTRSAEECCELDEAVGRENVFAVSGNPLQPYYTWPKLLWLLKHRPELREKLARVLGSNGYIVYRLTGRYSQDLCQAYGWGFFDVRQGCWNEEMARRSGVDPAWLPELCEPTAVVGTVSVRAALECGLREGIPVVAGGLDAACGAAGAGVIAPGLIHEQSGSAGGMSICEDACLPAEGLIFSRHVVPGMYLLQGGTVGGGGLVRWLDDVLYPMDRGNDSRARRGELMAEAEKVPAGSDGLIFLPYMSGERSPIWDPDAKGIYYGLNFSTTRGHLVRAVLEGAAFALQHNLEAARGAGIAVGSMLAVGGASANALWMQIKADVTGEAISPSSVTEATGLGCALMAGVGCGELKDFTNPFAGRAERTVTYVPDPARRAVYEKNYRQYLELYKRLSSRKDEPQ